MRGASAHRDRRPRPSGRLPATLTEAQLDGHACIHCGAEALPRRPVEAWSRLSCQLFECVDTEGCRHRCGGTTEGVAVTALTKPLKHDSRFRAPDQHG